MDIVDSGCRYLSQLPALLIGYQNSQSHQPVSQAIRIYQSLSLRDPSVQEPNHRSRIYLVSPHLSVVPPRSRPLTQPETPTNVFSRKELCQTLKFAPNHCTTPTSTSISQPSIIPVSSYQPKQLHHLQPTWSQTAASGPTYTTTKVLESSMPASCEVRQGGTRKTALQMTERSSAHEGPQATSRHPSPSPGTDASHPTHNQT